MKPAKNRRCKAVGCYNRFEPEKPFIQHCSPECGAAIGMAKLDKIKATKVKAEKRKDLDLKKEMRPRKWWLKKAKTALHTYIRERDEYKECISCDKILVIKDGRGGNFDAGHFRSVGSAKHMEFVEDNIHGQCKYCNDHLKGNALEYARRLRLRKGDAFVDAILSDNEQRHLTIQDFQEIEIMYKAKLKELRKLND